MFRRYPKLSLFYAIMIIVYLAQSFFVQPDRATLMRYHLSVDQARVLVATVALPYIIIWIVALIGYLRLHHYSQKIKGSPDGEAFAQISRGIFWFVIWLPISTIVSALVVKYYGAHPSSTDVIVRLNNYFNIIILLPGFYLTYWGTHKLLPLVKRTFSRFSELTNLGYLAFASLYTLLVLSDPARHHATSTVTTASYYEPDWLLVLTIVIPRILMWYIGLQAARNIIIYRKKVRGAIYKSALNDMAYGLVGVVGIIIVLRGFQSVSTIIVKANLGLLLAIIYALLILIAIGFALIARGAKRLQKFEEL